MELHYALRESYENERIFRLMPTDKSRYLPEQFWEWRRCYGEPYDKNYLLCSWRIVSPDESLWTNVSGSLYGVALNAYVISKDAGQLPEWRQRFSGPCLRQQLSNKLLKNSVFFLASCLVGFYNINICTCNLEQHLKKIDLVLRRVMLSKQIIL